MEESKGHFEIGDVVICIDPGYTRLIINKTYMVIDVCIDGNLKLKNEIDIHYLNKRFKKDPKYIRKQKLKKIIK